MILQNCHLATRILPSLEALLSNTPSIHQNFRFWWTAFPNKSLPTSLLDISVKVSLEVPTSLKSTVQSLWRLPPLCNSEFFTACRYPVELQRLVIGLTLFHSVVVERVQLCVEGGCHFSDSDLQVLVRQARSLLDVVEQMVELPSVISVLRSLAVEVIHGARLQNCYERRVLGALFDEMIHPELFSSDYMTLGQRRRNDSCRDDDGSIKIPLPTSSVNSDAAVILDAHLPSHCNEGLLYLDQKIIHSHEQACWEGFRRDMFNVLTQSRKKKADGE